MYTKEEEFGNANISQFIRLNNRLRANGFLSIPFLPDIASPARSLILNRNQAEENSNESTDYLRYINPGMRLSEKLVQTSMIPQNISDVATPQILAQIGESERQNDKFEITPGIRKYTDSEYSALNTDDLRTVGSILNGICAERENSFEKEQNANSVSEITREHTISERNKMDFPFDMPSNYSSKSGIKPGVDLRAGSSIELSFTNDQSDSLPISTQPESIESNQRLIVDGNKLISTLHNLLYELESRGERTVETLNSERSQKNGLIEKLNLLRRKYEALEKENDSLRMINRTLTEEEQSNRKNKAQGRETPQNSVIHRLEREKQQLLVENSRLKQDILKLQEDDDKSRDKADQFLRSIRNNLENERESNRAIMLSQVNTNSSNINNGTALTTTEKKKILQSHYIYSIIVGFEKSISYWRLQANNQHNLTSSTNKEQSFESHGSEFGNLKDTASEKSFFEFCQENNISTSELMKRDKNLWTRGLSMLQNTERSELESIIRWSCRLLNISNFRSIPIKVGELLSKKSTSSSPKITHVFESAPKKISSRNNNSQENISIELHDRFYNHFKTLFDVLDDQDVIQASNSIYIQLRDFKKFFRTICSTLSLDYKTTSPTECLKILNDLLSINHSKRAQNIQPQVQSYQENPSNVHNIIESLKIVLDVDSNDQILPTLKQHLESQSAIILSLSKN